MTPAQSLVASDRWYFGPLLDLLLGAGLGYVVLFGVLTLYGDDLRAFAPLGLLPLVLLVTGVPHYGATLVRLCDRPEDRRAYKVIAIAASLGMVAVLAICLRSALLGSALLTAFLTWSPWHYSGQNYGIALMFLRRRGVDVSPAARRWLQASFVLSFALVAFSIHGIVPGSDYAPVSYGGTVYRLLPVGIPDAIRGPAMIAIALAYVLSLAATAILLVRAGSVRDVAPAAAVVFSQALWFAVPALARYAGVFQVGPLSPEHAAYTFTWIAVAHSVQYLWVTSYFALRAGTVEDSRRVRFVSRYLAKVLAAGAALWVLPGLVFAPGGLASLPFDAGLAVMISAAINLHHFILDGVIWKLRDGRIARLLIGGGGPDRVERRASTKRRWPVTGVAWAVGALGVAVFAFGVLELELGAKAALARGDYLRAAQAADRLAWIGRDSAVLRVNTGLLGARQDDVAGGIDQIRRALDLFETKAGWVGLGFLYSRALRHNDAIDAYRKALELDPTSTETLNNLAWLLAVHGDGKPGSADESVVLATRASATLGHHDPTTLDTLAVAHAAAGHFRQSIRIASRALQLARGAGDEATASEIADRLRLYRAGRAYSVGDGP